SGISSGSLEHSFPAAAFRSCRIVERCSIRLQGTNTWSSSKPGIWTCRKRQDQLNGNVSSRSPGSLTLRSILAKPSALDARSRASWNSSLRKRLASITHRLRGLLQSAPSKNSSQLFHRPTSRKSPVDLSSMPTHQKSFPDWASPPRMYGVMTLVKFHSSSSRFFRLWDACGSCCNISIQLRM
uniref:Uncharacterized protein n=1 Tax=Pygocentrus nattereri TaxID=42514 RepID=A0A3B4DH68_PYGNA